MIFSASGWWLLAILAVMPWVGPFRGRNAVQNGLRSLAFVLLAAAMSRPQLSRDDAAVENVIVIDVSDSVEAVAVESAFKKLNSRTKDDAAQTHVVVVGDSDATELSKLRVESVISIQDNGSGSSAVASGLDRAALLIPRTSKGSVTLITDGLSTQAHDARAINGLLERGIAVDVVRVASKATNPTPVALQWTDELRVGSTARLRATIVARGGGSSGTVELRAGDEVLAEAAYTGADRDVVSLQFEPKLAGFVDVEVVVLAGEEERTLSTVLPVREPRELLYMTDLQENATDKLSEVLGPGFKVSAGKPSDEAGFGKAIATADLVVLDDVGTETVPRKVEEKIVEAVANEGLGMVMSGGRSAFGSGGWHDHPIESMLPVELVQKEEKRDPSTALVIVIDTSGSMSGVRVQLAKEVSRLAMRRLMPHDKVGIVEFFGAKRWAAPLQPASNQIELQRALNRMDAGGGTVILPALEESFYGLQNIDTRYKHVLVLTDGGVEAGDFESLMRRMAGEGINVSTVLCGGGYHSEFLVNIANWGKGRFYNVPNRFNLPEILLKQPSTAKLPSYRPGTHTIRARGGAGWWGDVDTSNVPMLAGYVETKSRPGSEVLLETVEGNHPILSTWRYGLGRVTTLATEPVGEGTRPWKDWDEYGRMLARIMERSAADTRDPFRFEVEYDGGEVLLHAIRQRARTGTANDAKPIARTVDGHELAFVARSPNRFLARSVVPERGTVLKLLAGSSTTPDRVEPIVVVSPIVGEDDIDPAAALDLEGIAAATDGRVLDLDADWSREIGPGGKRLVGLASYLFLATLTVFLCELVWRRMPRRDS